MRIQAWNCRGPGQRLTVRRLKEINREYLPDMLFLIETKQPDDYIRDIGAQLGFLNAKIVSPNGRSGGLVVLWKDYISVSCNVLHSRLVDICIDYKAFHFYLSCIYGHPVPRHRSHLWETLQRISTNRSGPWLMVGDFNEIRDHSEKKGGRLRSESSFQDFRDMMSVCAMTDLAYRGNRFSWVGHTRSEIVECCLDRAMNNPDWQNQYPNSVADFLDLTGSDHRPLLITIAYDTRPKRHVFRYDRQLISQPAFADSVKQFWITRQLQPSIFLPKLGACRSLISRWKIQHNYNAKEAIHLLRQQLDHATCDPQTSPQQLCTLREVLNTAYNDEETFWKLKSRNTWLQAGDRNTAFFHGITKTRKPKTCIKSITDDHGIVYSKDIDIGRIAESFFADLYTSSTTTQIAPSLLHIDSRVTPTINAQLTRLITDDEIHQAVTMLGTDKAPRHDGFSASFYQDFWPEVGPHVCLMIKNFFYEKRLEPAINHTHLCLIPKVTNPCSMNDYRPISLCTVSYKIISKILVLRLKEYLDQIISPTQAAFVPGRKITDNVLLAHELLHALKSKKNCAEQYLAVKTNISKAYDRVEWSFLEGIMRRMGFDEQWIQWIMTCVTTVSYSVLINGAAYGNIHPTRGLRQGDPLSPYLFLFCAEALSQLLTQATTTKELTGMKISRSCPMISHLLFADDSLFFCRATYENCARLARVFAEYEAVSGQKINLQKSSIIFGMKIPWQRRQRIHQIFGISRVGGGGKYLGLPEQLDRNRSSTFQSLVSRVETTLTPWYHKFLTPAGKETLIKAIAQAQPIYPISCFLLPKKVCNAIASRLSKFWWGESSIGQRKISWISWKRLSLPKKEGGLGFRDLHHFNKALLGKQAWRILQNPNSLLAQVYKGRYHSTTTFWNSVYRPNSSYGWKFIQIGKQLLHGASRVQIGNGADTNLWTDHWLPVLPPRPARRGNGAPHLTVSLIYGNQGSGNGIQSSYTILHPTDAAITKQLRLSRYAGPDKIIWPYTSNGQYAVKSGYWVSSHDIHHPSRIKPPPGSLDIKCGIWKLPILPKMKIFLWKVLANALPTAQNLHSRICGYDPSCSRCSLNLETTNHLLFECPYAQSVWRCAGIRCFDNSSIELEGNFRKVLRILDTEQIIPSLRLLPIWLLWYIWTSRNKLIFRQDTISPQTIIEHCSHAIAEWLVACPWPRSRNPSTPTPTVSASAWLPPPIHWLKCNFTAISHPHCGITTIGWLIRTSTGRFLEAGWANLPTTTSTIQAEAIGFLYVLQYTWARGWRCIWFETTSNTLTRIINKQEDSVLLGNVLHDIRYWTSKLPLCSLATAPRAANKAAVRIARSASQSPNTCIVLSVPPRWLHNYLLVPNTI